MAASPRRLRRPMRSPFDTDQELAACAVMAADTMNLSGIASQLAAQFGAPAPSVSGIHRFLNRPLRIVLRALETHRDPDAIMGNQLSPHIPR
jgi:hypothetical protein